MFSLIITIISIALVAALAVATIYYGGSAFTQGTAKANASALVSAGQQVTGALTLYANDHGGTRPTDPAELTAPTDGGQPYLSALPAVKGVTLAISSSPDMVTASAVDSAVCDAINVSAGITTATAPATSAAASTTPYFCAKDFTFVFKG